MKLIRGFQPVSELAAGSVVTIGNFDGVHLGHQALLSNLRSKATQGGLPLVVVLFEPQPAEYFLGIKSPARISSLREKLDVLGSLGVDFVYCIKFDKALALMPAEVFVNKYLFSILHTKYLLVGHDFRFGFQREGDVELLKTLGSEQDVHVETFADFAVNAERVSSTKIRQALQVGNLTKAHQFLGRRFSLCGRVISGAGRGRTWGIPTANISLHRINLPLLGVFCVQVKRKEGKMEYGVANLGNRPTVDGTKLILEVHLFDVDESFYGEIIHVYFLHKLRDEKKFSSMEDLIVQIQDDISKAKDYFMHNLVHTE